LTPYYEDHHDTATLRYTSPHFTQLHFTTLHPTTPVHFATLHHTSLPLIITNCEYQLMVVITDLNIFFLLSPVCFGFAIYSNIGIQVVWGSVGKSVQWRARLISGNITW